jgi:hypothetical protein
MSTFGEQVKIEFTQGRSRHGISFRKSSRELDRFD